MQFLVWVMIGRFTLQAWLAINPINQTEVFNKLAQGYCEYYACKKMRVAIVQDEKHITLYAECDEVML